jgi:NTP pyrophosphatase (non-canonical NTP hydrolase)
MERSLSIKELQEYIKAKDYNPSAKKEYFLKLIEEIGELSEVIRKDLRMTDEKNIKGTIEEELYDVLYYICALANLYDIDLEESFSLKEKLNREKWGK